MSILLLLLFVLLLPLQFRKPQNRVLADLCNTHLSAGGKHFTPCVLHKQSLTCGCCCCVLLLQLRRLPATVPSTGESSDASALKVCQQIRSISDLSCLPDRVMVPCCACIS